MKQDILIVLSRKDKPELVCAVLAHHGITAASAENIKEAIQRLEARTSAFLLLDLDLNGADLFLDAVVTSFYDPPPYLLVADDFFSSAERTNTLNRGADVCLEKPVDAEEVAAVINAALRRAARLQRKGIKLAPCIIHKEMTIDPLRRAVVMRGQTVNLTAREFDILYLLASYPGIVFSKGQIYKHVWNEDYKFATTSVTDLISSLRRKLGLNIRDKQYIQTIYNSGYRFATK
jgi:DNA-binding response OmpR family regulator